MGYGGDFGDIPNDGNFIMDGVVFSDHTPSPGLTEYAKAIEPVQVLEFDGNSKVGIVNRYDFIGLEHLDCKWYTICQSGKLINVGGGTFQLPEGEEWRHCLIIMSQSQFVDSFQSRHQTSFGSSDNPSSRS